jgi:hypothetical protein
MELSWWLQRAQLTEPHHMVWGVIVSCTASLCFPVHGKSSSQREVQWEYLVVYAASMCNDLNPASHLTILVACYRVQQPCCLINCSGRLKWGHDQLVVHFLSRMELPDVSMTPSHGPTKGHGSIKEVAMKCTHYTWHKVLWHHGTIFTQPFSLSMENATTPALAQVHEEYTSLQFETQNWWALYTEAENNISRTVANNTVEHCTHTFHGDEVGATKPQKLQL